MFVDFLIKGFAENIKSKAIAWDNREFDYHWLLDKYKFWKEELKSSQITSGTVVILEGDFTPNSVALLLVLIEVGSIIVPISNSNTPNRDNLIRVAGGEILVKIDGNDKVTVSRLPYKSEHRIYQQLRKLHHPGLVLFTSGSTGKSKASVHDVTAILEKFKVRRHSLRTITFLFFDHIGGINTLFYVLSNVGLIVTVRERTPDTILQAVETYKVELLPTSPTFLNLLLLSESYKRYDISSLKTISYGTEPMMPSTLDKFTGLFPNIRLLQTYGLSEIGILRSKSKYSNSLWMKIGGEGFETRVADGMLEVKAKSAMLGYLNAENPFTHDGWFKTNDVVEVDGDYIRIIGRKSEIINVGGEKVYPQEVDNVIQEMDNVAEATVYGEANAIVGNIVCVKVRLLKDEEKQKFARRLQSHCKEKLKDFQVPVKVTISDSGHYTERFKKNRKVK